MRKWSLDRKLETSRRNYARRCYKKAPLMALLLIRERYENYTEQQLLEDLKRKTTLKVKPKKVKTAWDFRSQQIVKYEIMLHTTDPKSTQYNRVCNMLAALIEAHKERHKINVHVVKADCKIDYWFSWKTKERYIIEFITLANKKSSTHEELGAKQEQIQKLTAGLLAG